jgi:thioredoxin 1
VTWTIVLAQDSQPTGPHQRANEGFMGWGVAAVLLAAVVLAVILAWRRAKSRPSTLPEWDDETFETEVLGSRVPVLVHFSRAWHVGDRAALSQTELLAWQNRGAVTVGLLDIDRNPKTMDRFPGLEPPAYLLFYQGRKLWHRPGLRIAGDLQTDIDVALSREGF